MKLFHFDIETAGNYPDYQTFKSEDERGAKLFENKYNKRWANDYTIDEAYVNNAGIISTYGRICCISFGVVEADGNKKISSYY